MPARGKGNLSEPKPSSRHVEHSAPLMRMRLPRSLLEAYARLEMVFEAVSYRPE